MLPRQIAPPNSPSTSDSTSARSPTTNRTPGGSSASRAFSIISSEASSPTTSNPCSARNRACSPVPHPTSNTRRDGPADNTSSRNGHSRSIRAGQAISRR